VDRRIALFVLLFGSLSLLLWVNMAGEVGVHYTLHFTPWLVLGLFAVLWTLGTRVRPPAARALGLLLATGYLLGNVAFALQSPEYQDVSEATRHAAGAALFARYLGPYRRQDYGEIVRLVDYLAREAGDDLKPIYVAASSPYLNDDLLWHANRVLHEDVLSYGRKHFWDSRHLNILHWVPLADSRDTYPLDKLMASEYVVVATPFQYHLHPEEQKVVQVVVTAFTEPWPFARDFVRLPETFTVGDGVTVVVYRRQHRTSLATAIRTLSAMKEFIGRRPGRQSNWVGLGGSPETYVNRVRENNDVVKIVALVNSVPATLPFLYTEKPPARARVTGSVKADDAKSILGIHLDAVDTAGKSLASAQSTPTAGGGDFDLTLPTNGAAHLLARVTMRGVTSKPEFSSWMSVNNLTVSDAR
jgi:hypothetical protein